MPTAPLTVDEATSVTFISGVTANETVAAQSFWDWTSGSDPASYSAGANVHKFGGSTLGTSGGTVTYAFDAASAWTVAEKASFVGGLALWSAIANVTFVAVAAGSTAALTFTRGGSGAETDASWSGRETTGGTAADTTTSDDILIDTAVYSWQNLGSFTFAGGYGVDTVLHEEGHVLGLGHAGPYNGTVDLATQQLDATDTRQWSIMSYIEPGDPAAKYQANYTVQNTAWEGSDPTTPMPLDILAAQRLYGAAIGGPLAGGQVFGFHTNIAAAIQPFFDFTVNTKPVVTIYDSGTGNTLDLSGFTQAAIVNLNPGTFSSADGLTNNIGIAFGTAVDAFIGGAGDDVIAVNGGGDTIDGGGGANSVLLWGTRAQYSVHVSRGGVVTVIDGVAGRNGTDMLTHVQSLGFSDQTVAVAALPVLPEAASDFNGDGTSDQLWQRSDGAIIDYAMSAGAVASGTVIGLLPSGNRFLAAADFNGDGTTDQLWADPYGNLFDGTMSQGHIASFNAVGVLTGGEQFLAAADFNGDGTADLMLDNAAGVEVVFTVVAGAITGAAFAGVITPGDKFLAAADFNGDGTADQLWETPSGALVDATMHNGAIASVAVVGGVGAGFTFLAAADLNGDGTADLLWENAAGVLVDYGMKNGAIAASSVLGVEDPTLKFLGAGDTNGDGTADILMQASNGGLVDFTVGNATITGGAVIGALDPTFRFLA